MTKGIDLLNSEKTNNLLIYLVAVNNTYRFIKPVSSTQRCSKCPNFADVKYLNSGYCSCGIKVLLLLLAMSAQVYGVWWVLGETITILLYIKKAKTIKISDRPFKKGAKILYNSDNLNIIRESVFFHTLSHIEESARPAYLLLTIDDLDKYTLINQIPYAPQNDKILLPLHRTVVRERASFQLTMPNSKQPFVVAADTANQVVSKIVQETIKQIEGLIYSL
jgi:hypothetical protein